MAGRPTKYTKELEVEICTAIANSNKGLVPLCEENEHWPTHSTIRQWIFEKKEFSDNYVKAKQEQADFLADEIIKIADDEEGDMIQGEFGKVGNSVNVQRSRLKIDARKWIASKLKPKMYGDKMDVTSDGDKITSFNVGFNKEEKEE